MERESTPHRSGLNLPVPNQPLTVVLCKLFFDNSFIAIAETGVYLNYSA